VRLRIGLREDVAVDDPVVLAFVAPLAFVNPGLADDLHELLGAAVALIVVEEVAVGGELGGEAASDDVDKDAALELHIEGVGHPGGKRRGDEAGAHGDEELQPLGAGADEGGDEPGVPSGADGDQREVEA
jgi:hypothetical protein